MKKGLTELIFVIDCSGSMYGLEKDTIGGFNSVIDKQKAGVGEVLVSTILFSDKTFVLHDRLDIKKVGHLNMKEYQVGGGTALLDAVGNTIHHISNIHKYAREEDRPEHVLFFITTDGVENSSCLYTYDKVKTMIDFEKEKYGWEFVFMGANIDAFDVASRMGIARERTANIINDKDGIKAGYGLLNSVACCVRCMEGEAFREAVAGLFFNENRVTEERKCRKNAKK